MVLCHGLKRTHIGDYNILEEPCGEPAVQFILEHSNSVTGVCWPLAFCEDHRCPDQPHLPGRWVCEAQEISEDEYHVAAVMCA
ncbi:MAG: hypothetical protein ACRD6W_16175 [Nitrososphaerales archaeon]